MQGPDFDLSSLETPAYVIDLGRLRRNLSLLDVVQQRTGARVLLALKGYAAHATFPLIREVLSGAAASSVAEAHLARELGREVHVYAPAFSELDVTELLPLADHVVFNSVGQLERFGERFRAGPRRAELGLRINPEHRETAVALYDPCAPGSRLGVPRAAMPDRLVGMLDGLHFHNLCEKDSDALERTLEAVEARFSPFIRGVKWVNFGGGHLITRTGYDLERLVSVVQGFLDRHQKQVYLEPGEAVAYETGWLVGSVLDVFDYGVPTAILDVSATAHMPDVLEMPYRPKVIGAGGPSEKAFTYRLGGLTCLAGDVIGDYSFDAPLTVGTRVVFCDMAHYTMVKNTTFNGVRLPSIVTYEPASRELCTVRRFGVEDYRSRLS